MVAGDGSGGVPMLGEVAFVGAAAATLAGPGVAAAASLVRAAADVALSELRHARESAREGRHAGGGNHRDRRAGRSSAPKRKKKKKERIMGRASAFGNLLALPRKTRGLEPYYKCNSITVTEFYNKICEIFLFLL